MSPKDDKLAIAIATSPAVGRSLYGQYNRDAVNDAVQDVLLRLIERPATLDKVKNMPAFLRTSVKNQIIDTGRRRQAEMRALERMHTNAPSPASRQGVASGLSRRAQNRGHGTRPAGCSATEPASKSRQRKSRQPSRKSGTPQA